MRLPLDLSIEQVRDLDYYLTNKVAYSENSGEYVPDVLYSILGHLSVYRTSHYINSEKANHDSVQESDKE